MKDTELEIGVVGRPHGVRGAFRLWLHNDESELADGLESLRLESPDGAVRETLGLRSLRDGPRSALVAEVEGVDSRDAAAARCGWKILIDKAALPDPGEDEFYYYEVPGFSVVTEQTGRSVGTVIRVTETSVDVLVVRLESGGELMIPVVSDFVAEIDRAGRRVVVVEDVESYFE